MTLIPEVRDELYATAARVAERAPGGRIRRALARGVVPRVFSPGAVGLAVSVACVIAVAGLALVELGHRRSDTSASHPIHHRPSSQTLDELGRELGILRRAQTADDRTLPRWAQFRTVIPATVRLARTVNTATAGPVRIYVCITRPPNIRGSQRRSYEITTIWVSAQRRSFGIGRLSDGPGNPTSGISTSVRSSGVDFEPDAGVTVSLVPDSVSRVRWVFSGVGIGVTHPHQTVLNVPVADNIAALPLNARRGPLKQVTWYDAGGQAVAGGVDLQGRQRIAAINAFNASGHNPIALTLREHFALFRATAPASSAVLSRLVAQAGAGFPGIKLNWLQTRYIDAVTGLDGRGLWITPGSNGLAISDPQAGGVNTLGRGLKNFGFLGVSTSNSHQTTISGLVPDGNQTITLLLANGSRQTVPIVDHNAFEATVTGRVIAIIDRGLNGQTTRNNLR